MSSYEYRNYRVTVPVETDEEKRQREQREIEERQRRKEFEYEYGAAPTKRMSEDAAPGIVTEPGIVTDVRAGEWIDERYEVVQLLSTKGGEATVYLCRDHQANAREVVVKLYKQHFRPKREIVARLIGLKHEDIIQVFDFAEWGGRFYEVMEYARGGCVYEPGQRLDENKITEILHVINNALHFCHVHNIVHRDVKPTNFFYRNADKTDVVLGDFGISSIMEEGEELRATTGHKTPEFSAPELFRGKVHIKTDYYALGITLLALAKGQSPFAGWTDEAIMDAHTFSRVQIPDSFSPRFRQLLRGLLTNAIDDRWGYEQVSRWLAGETVEVPQTKRMPLGSGLEYAANDQAGKLASEILLSKSEKRRQPFVIAHRIKAYSLHELAKIFQDDWECGCEIIKDSAKDLCDWVAKNDVKLANRIFTITKQRSLSAEIRLMQIICLLDRSCPYLLLPEQSARTPEQLAELIDRTRYTWEAAREQLYSGLIPTWLYYTQYAAYAREWDKRKENFKDRDQALEWFLHVLDKELSSPRIKVTPKALDFKEITCGEQKSLWITISNKERGYLCGKIRVDCFEPVHVTLSRYRIQNRDNPIAVTVKVPKKIEPGDSEFFLRIGTNAKNGDEWVKCRFTVTKGVASTNNKNRNLNSTKSKPTDKKLPPLITKKRGRVTTPKVFISHAWKDKALVKRLEAELNAAGAEVWVDLKNIHPGDSLTERISDGLRWCNTFLLIWSDTASRSPWVNKELKNAISLHKKIIPCRLGKTELPSILADTIHLKFGDFDKGLSQLCTALNLAKKPKPRKA